VAFRDIDRGEMPCMHCLYHPAPELHLSILAVFLQGYYRAAPARSFFAYSDHHCGAFRGIPALRIYGNFGTGRAPKPANRLTFNTIIMAPSLQSVCVGGHGAT
jgi:hypothetical protein